MIFKTLVFVFLFFLEGYCALQEVIDFKKTVTTVIDTNSIEEVRRVGDKARRMNGNVSDSVDNFIRMARKNTLPPKWIDWFQRTFGRHGNISQRTFAAAIFYPYELMEASYKYHISQVSPILKACVYYSLKLDPEGLWVALNPKVTDWYIKSDDDLLDWVDITFVAHNGAFTEKAREYLRIGDNLDRLFAHIIESGTPTQQFNFGVIAKSIGEVSKSLSCFYEASIKGSKRAQLELAYHNLETSVDTLSSISDVSSYGVWKVAQCFRYGKKVAKDLKEANRYYLQALAGADEFPEIAYDTGDFVEELALGQKDKGRFIETARKAIEYFNMAGDRHLGSSYIRAARLMITARERFSDLATTDFNDDAISDLAFKAAQEGAYEKAKSLLERIGRDASSLLSPETVEMSKFIKDVDKELGL